MIPTVATSNIALLADHSFKTQDSRSPLPDRKAFAHHLRQTITGVIFSPLRLFPFTQITLPEGAVSSAHTAANIYVLIGTYVGQY
ncbi:hypothetical protein A0H81_11725 [Grifola frondosa]|uniref:Uncharacterized protein n=1 Tax=Grifola frondosa TaxID=5627 RepID=A0A1C7LUZ9_GRIFR|nr:hypothetical protein A0H81_11725 [Grifola frondosa]